MKVLCRPPARSRDGERSRARPRSPHGLEETGQDRHGCTDSLSLPLDTGWRTGNICTKAVQNMVTAKRSVSVGDPQVFCAVTGRRRALSRSKKKLTVNLSEELVAVLRELADRNGSSMTEEIKKAIQDRAYFADKIADGNEVVLESDSTDGTRQRTLVDLR